LIFGFDQGLRTKDQGLYYFENRRATRRFFEVVEQKNGPQFMPLSENQEKLATDENRMNADKKRQ